MLIISKEIKKTKEMETYEKETGKHALWHGSITDRFKKWKRGEKIYDKDKERISLYIDEDKKAKWVEFSKKNNFSTISKFIRNVVNDFIEKNSILSNKSIVYQSLDTIESLSHNLKEPLTLIKGYLQILIEDYKDTLNKDVVELIDNCIEQCTVLEQKIFENLDNIHTKLDKYDILIIEDNIPTVKLLISYFERKNYKCKGVFTGFHGLELLKTCEPKIILLDIILPDINGFDLCKAIKADDKTKDIRVYFLTAVPIAKVESMMDETNADGVIQKPFNLSDLNLLFDQL